MGRLGKIMTLNNMNKRKESGRISKQLNDNLARTGLIQKTRDSGVAAKEEIHRHSSGMELETGNRVHFTISYIFQFYTDDQARKSPLLI